MEIKELLLNNINKIHTTDLGSKRIKNNLELIVKDGTLNCQSKNNSDDIESYQNNNITKKCQIQEQNDIIKYCQNKIKDKNSIVIKKGKNFYVEIDNIIFTINSYNYCIITAHLQKNKKGGKKYVI